MIAGHAFCVSEVSSPAKKDKGEKVLALLLLPGLEDADERRRLEPIRNIHSDGRPILGLDCGDLLEIMLETSPEALYVPAHIWTPHFSMFGAFSGFDAIEDCYEDMTPVLLETGFPLIRPADWSFTFSFYRLISNSDAFPASLDGKPIFLRFRCPSPDYGCHA